MVQNQNDGVGNNLITQTNDFRAMFQHHGNQLLKFHFLPFLSPEERTRMRSACQTFQQNIPKPQYLYFKSTNSNLNLEASARIETNTGFVDTRGHPSSGGDSSAVRSELQYGVKTIFFTQGAFAALKTNGSVVTWGVPFHGGDSSSVSSDLQSDVATISATEYAFAALKTNGRVITWGEPDSGGDSSNVISYLQSDVKSIISAWVAFAALKTNGSVVTWGDPNCGGDSSMVSQYLQNGVIKIVACGSTDNEFLDAFRATKADGSQIEWPYFTSIIPPSQN